MIAERTTSKKFLGYIGIVIVIVGAAVAGLGVWYVQTARPIAGPVIDEIDIGGGQSIVLREQQGGPNSFIEVRRDGKLAWQAMIPKYAGTKGRPAIAWGRDRVTVRVERAGRAEVFGFLISNATKLGTFRLSAEREPIHVQGEGPITLTDGEYSFELTSGADWAHLIAVDLRSGNGAWKVDLGAGAVTAADVRDGVVWIEHHGSKRGFDRKTGREVTPDRPLN